MKLSLVFTVAVLVLSQGCKKDDNPTQPPPNPASTTCNFTTDVVVVDGTSGNVIKANCSTPGSSYIAEFLTDTSVAPTGIALVFSTATSPDSGNYATQADAAHIAAGEVYVEYYNPTTAWHATTGTVHVAQSGAAKIFTFCSLTLTAGGTSTKSVSIRGTCN